MLLESDGNSLALERKQNLNSLFEADLECKVMQLRHCRLVTGVGGEGTAVNKEMWLNSGLSERK